MTEVECPFCPESRKSALTGPNGPVFAVAQHVHHRGDHPDISYGEAKAKVIEYNEGNDFEDNEDNINEEPDVKEKQFSDMGGKTGRVKRVEIPPMQDTQILLADGGEEQEDNGDDNGTDNEKSGLECPDCNIPMSNLSEGTEFNGADGNKYVADGGERICPKCKTVKDGDKWL